LIFRETGEPKSVLKLEEIPNPPLAPGEALVRVLLSPINASDLHMVRGRYGYQPELPASPGIEEVGIVEAVGPGVQGLMAGTRSFCSHMAVLSRPICLVQFEQRSGDNFAVAFACRWIEIWASA
jgi:NADPH:quinone reductase-like Zn-dependent oxidoreductase